MTATALFLAVFLACAVEAVEAATVVLAAGTGRDWRSALLGAAAGIGVLVAIVAALGPAVTAIPLGAIRLVVGAVLLVFGLQWLRKAILRASGYKAQHDEDEIYRTQLAAAQAAPATPGRTVTDPFAFTLSFKAVVLEGLEVVVIVVSLGVNHHDLPLAVLAGVAAIVVVGVAAVIVRAPLARVPENTMKFVVGVMLTGFGTFWAVEGAHGRWPGSDAALLVIIAAVAVLALALVALLRRRRATTDRPDPADRSRVDA
jgi:uncharacterized membrane protein